MNASNTPKGDAFEHRKATGIELFSYLTRVHTATIILLSIFSLAGTIRLKNVGETNVLACETFTCSFYPWLKNVTWLSSLFS